MVDERLALLRDYCADVAREIRHFDLQIDRNPDSVEQWLDHPAVHVLRACTVPAEHMDVPLRISGHAYDISSCLEHTVVWEAQRKWYFERLGEAPRWTFFALTEPDKGSAAVELTAPPTPDGDDFLLHGQKRYVDNAAHASAITLSGVRVRRDQVLGFDRRPTRRGLVGAIRTPHAVQRRLDAMRDAVAAAQARNYRVTAAIDAGQVRGGYPARRRVARARLVAGGPMTGQAVSGRPSLRVHGEKRKYPPVGGFPGCPQGKR